MKKAILLLMCLLGTSAYADTTAVEELLYDGMNTSEEINLSTEKTRTEYRNVQVPATCYRQEYQRRCERRPRVCQRVCDRNGNCRRICSGGARVCRNVIVTIPYPCTRIERRAYQVHEYFVETNVKFQFNNSQVAQTVAENFKVIVNGERVALQATGSSNYFLVLDNQHQTESRVGGIKYINQVYKVSLIPALAAKSVLANGIQEVKLRNGILSFKLGAGFDSRAFTQQIKVFQNRRLGTDTLLLDKMLTTNDMDINTTANASYLAIDLNNLGINLPAKLRVILDTKYKINENRLLNKGQINTQASANWIFR